MVAFIEWVQAARVLLTVKRSARQLIHSGGELTYGKDWFESNWLDGIGEIIVDGVEIQRQN